MLAYLVAIENVSKSRDIKNLFKLGFIKLCFDKHISTLLKNNRTIIKYQYGINSRVL